MLLLIFIYYYKGILSISDIQTLLKPVTEQYFHKGTDFNLEDVYREAFSMEEKEMEALKADVTEKFRTAQETFQDAPEEERDFLRKFAFVCTLSFDVYIKKMIIEKIIDDLREDEKKEAKRKSHGGRAEKPEPQE